MLETRSSSGNRHSFDAEGGRVDRPAIFEVARRGENCKHVGQINGNGDLRHRCSERAILDQEARSAPAVTTGYDIPALADEFGDEESGARFADQIIAAD